MKLKKLNFLLVIIVCIILLVSGTPTLGGAHGLVNQGVFDRYRINAWWDIQHMDSNTDAFVIHGIGFPTDYNFAVDLPVFIDYYINGDKVKMKRYTETWPNQWYWTSPGPDVIWLGEHKGGVQQIWFMFYQTFDAGYFTPGEYELHIDYFIQKDVSILEINGLLIVH